MNRFVVLDGEVVVTVNLSLAQDGDDFTVFATAPGKQKFRVVSLRTSAGKLAVVRWSHGEEHSDLLEIDRNGRIKDLFA